MRERISYDVSSIQKGIVKEKRNIPSNNKIQPSKRILKALSPATIKKRQQLILQKTVEDVGKWLYTENTTNH